jgi:hypothetical protein
MGNHEQENLLGMQNLHRWATARNTLVLTRNEIRSAVRVRSSALRNRLTYTELPPVAESLKMLRGRFDTTLTHELDGDVLVATSIDG